ncbi:Sua5/YciO/YrdC/YwlC family protein [Teladorsagia circumcincta]|uniref:Threonylcarbamoyl-AMP synthase n=1 Tax=Teladorsagia circumcincta TaxID=45464 RepID=A0A2G9TBQ5_TELCI|nr:Sua5/YciO/YrdC/YwlC family protein [Teladorsagia circumcincta]
MPTEALTHLAKVLRLTPETFEEAVEAAADVLLRGGIVALPTDTIYGVSTLIQHSAKLYSLKRRPASKPLGLFLTDPAEIPRWAQLTISPHLAQQLLPGPVTLIFNRLPSLPMYFNPDREDVGIRVPASPLVRALTGRLGQPLAQTSANVSGSVVNPTCVSDFSNLLSEIDLVLDGGMVGRPPSAGPSTSEGSTIVDLTQDDFYRIVREGCALKRTEELLRAAGIRPL